MGTIKKFLLGLFENTSSVNPVTSVPPDLLVVKAFGGVPLSKLDELAKSVYHGIGATIDEYGFLLFHYVSKSGKTKYHAQMQINEAGKLVNLFSGTYLGQWRSSADEFVKKANEVFTFAK